MSNTLSQTNLLERCGIPKRFQEAGLSHFSNPISEIGRSGKSLFVTGPRGTGKTHFLCACLKHVILEEARSNDPEIFINPKKLPAEFLPVPEFMLELRQSYEQSTPYTEAEVLRKYSRINLLVLDDLGAERVSDWSIQMLYLLLDRRNRDLKQTMISSNLSLREIADNFDDRVASRIAEECQPVKFRGQDKRTAKSRSTTENTKKRQEIKKVVPWR